MRVVTTYHDKPVQMYGLSFASWSTRSGPLFITERIYLKGYKWTPFVRYYKRYDGWFDGLKDNNNDKHPHPKGQD